MRLGQALAIVGTLIALPTSSASAVTITEFSAGISPGGAPYGIAAGPDGNVWFTEPVGRVGKITPAGVVTEFAAGITPGMTPGSHPQAIASGPDGNIWYTANDGPPSSSPTGTRIVKVTPAGGVTEYTSGVTQPLYVGGITAGPDGNVWYVAGGFIDPNPVSIVGRVTPEGVVTEFSDGIQQAGILGDIAAGPDGNLWFTSVFTGKIGRITPSGTVTEFSAGVNSNDITAGPDGNMWFAGATVGRITPLGVVTKFPTTFASAIATGPDGNLWFTGNDPNRISRITPAGVVREFTSGLSSQPVKIAAGMDGNMWFSETYADKLGRLEIRFDAPLVTVGDARAITLTESTLVGTVNPRNEPTSYHFEYGTTTAYGSQTPAKDAPAGSADSEVTEVVTGLAPETTYHYRLVATNSEGGTASSEDHTFTTPPELDRDGDGSPRPADCDDGNAAISPERRSCPTTRSTRTARAARRRTSTATATGSTGPRTATTPTQPSTAARWSAAATTSTRTATASSCPTCGSPAASSGFSSPAGSSRSSACWSSATRPSAPWRRSAAAAAAAPRRRES